MACSTSSKQIFALTKYSRAVYKQSDNVQNTQGCKGDCDWQHHTQPILRLLLELCKSAQGVPESVRLRVVWTVEKGHVPANSRPQHQENNIFEDVDLLVVRKHIHPFPTQGLPLKAVFRDNMVGVRYLPPQAKSNSPFEYRRFQMTFQSTNDSTAFINAIRDVCPCKPSPVNNPSASIESSSLIYPRGSQMTQGSQQPRSPFPAQFLSQYRPVQIPSGSRVAAGPGQRTSDCLSMLPSSQANRSSDLPPEFSVPFHQSRRDNPVLDLDHRLHAYHSYAALSRQPSIVPPQQATQMDLSSSSSLSLSGGPFNLQTQQRSNIQLNSRQPSVLVQGSNVRDNEIARSDPCPAVMPTPPTSSQGPDLSAARRPAQLQPQGSSTDTDADCSVATKHPLLESLYEACKIDNLARDELEQLVADIVREDGFAELLEKIDCLWQLKVAINI